MDKQDTHLTSAEIANLWTSYMNNSMSIVMLSFMLQHIQDKEIKEAVQKSYDIAQHYQEETRSFFEAEACVMPDGFSEGDVHMDAPWLFSDIFCLTYVHHMSKVGMINYSGFLGMSRREDIRSFYTRLLSDTSSLYNQTTETAVSKGIHATYPYLEIPKEQEYIEGKQYLSGLHPLRNKRALNAVETAYLYMNILTNTVGEKLAIAFAQTSTSKEIQDYMIRGKDIATKHIKIFASTLQENDIVAARLPDLGVSSSTTRAFSDKLMMFHMSVLTSAGTGNYALAAASSLRTDLALNYERLSLEVARYAKSGVEIMIKHNWMEQPPKTADRDKLSRKKV
ncbi:DUF3231 family protein [Salibacterium qingdaonense]|uniref:DUF3231 family protein n=1 Tax=Salibacterium qingdaonense TaxID=266892 RepID=A0A1I4KJB4_9BACI|nr:DUF3231 family protein [Salibacterium qingdaonense]SFL78814.1 Protein of unknown function [Salibacterium qingdaonense]